jgi:hypothetical protein
MPTTSAPMNPNSPPATSRQGAGSPDSTPPIPATPFLPVSEPLSSPSCTPTPKINFLAAGYVYILEVKDIVLPVCKIGMTSRDPIDRCAEINKSSTGDFIWAVAYKIAVNDCSKLESLVHKKLEPLRQKNREFFNICPADAYVALQSIISSQTEFKEISIEEVHVPKTNMQRSKCVNSPRKSSIRKIDTEYAEILQSFNKLIGIKGRPFGQLNQPYFGMSDGNEGVQWNIGISTDPKEIRVGVNLEGMKYSNWPITNFILKELAKPTINDLKLKLEQPKNIFIQFRRDAWQYQSRPTIIEQYINAQYTSIAKIEPGLWKSTLTEARSCLNENRQYRGRGEQEVTLANQPKNGEMKRTMSVTPHLYISTPIETNGNIIKNLEAAITRLKPVYEWVTSCSAS